MSLPFTLQQLRIIKAIAKEQSFKRAADLLFVSQPSLSKQVKILDEAQKDFDDVLFLSFEQTKDKEVAKLLGIEYWTTIVIYKNNKEVVRSIGQTSRSKIYSLIESI